MIEILFKLYHINYVIYGCLVILLLPKVKEIHMVRFSCSYGAISCFNGEDNLYSSGMASFIVAWPDCFVYDDRVNDINWAGITY